jgi:zinc protease
MTEFRQVISDRPIKDEELRDAKDRLTRTLAGRWETGNAVISALQEILMFDLPEDYYRTFAQKVRAVTTVELSKAVKAALSPTATVWVVVGDRAKVEAGIRELKMGPVQLLDAEGRPVRP